MRTPTARHVTFRGTEARAEPALFYAAQSGRSTLDEGEGGGNPFASAFVELLARPKLSLHTLSSELIELTSAKSDGYQTPSISRSIARGEWRVRPAPSGSLRVALVLVYADYARANAQSLPGALRDLTRTAAALALAGFQVVTVADPMKAELTDALQLLERRSRAAEAAVIYTTGHGVEYRGQAYLIPGDYPIDDGPGRLRVRGLRVASLTDHLNARSANLVFYGGCRTHW
ncbi:MAG: caspase family protein [Gemmatimonadaceae bacterium]